MSITRETAQTIITPDISRPLLEAIFAAYGDWDKHVSDEARATTSLTTKANFINDRMIFQAKDRLQSHSKVEFVVRHGRTHLFIGGTLEIKLKKLNRNLRPANIQTVSVTDYHNQVVQLPLPLLDLPDALANLIAGYQESRLRTGVEAVYIIHPKGERNSWQWRLEFDSSQVPLPTPEAPPIVTPPQVKRVKKITPKKELHEAKDKRSRP
ncbi:MAG: hypothetical protein HYX89_01875 [Chloroflexi bacterium]|nr:hypothetical protein [Chloroflexota bacterium]